MSHTSTSFHFLDRLVYLLSLAIVLFLFTLKPLALIAFFLLSLIGIYLFATRQSTFHIHPYIKLFGILSWGYFGVMAFSTLFADDTLESIKHLPLISHFLFAPFVALAIAHRTISLQKLHQAIKIATIGGGLIAIIECIVKGSFSFHCSGMYHHNTFGDLIAIFTALSLVQLIKEDQKGRLLSIFALIMGVLGVILSGSRGALIALTLLIPAVSIFLVYQTAYKKVLWGIPVAIIVLLGAVFTNDNLMLKKKFSIISHELSHWNDKTAYSSVGTRIQMYVGGTKAFVQRPIFGYGFFNSTKAASQFLKNDPKLRHTIATQHWHLHNEVLNTAVQAGIIGLGAFFALMLLPLRMFWRERHNNPYALMGVVLIVGYFLIGLTHTVFGYEYETAFFLFFLAYLLIGSHRVNATAQAS